MAKKLEKLATVIEENPFDGLNNLGKDIKKDQEKAEELKRKTFLAEKAHQYEEISEYLVKKFGIKFKSYSRNKDIDSINYDFTATFEDGTELNLTIRGKEDENW